MLMDGWEGGRMYDEDGMRLPMFGVGNIYVMY